MAWIEFHTRLRDHWKIDRLKDTLKIPYAHALGLVGCLWTWAAENAKNGNLSKFTDSEICRAMRYEGQPEGLKNILIKCEFIDKSGFIHDWKKHGLRLLKSSQERVKRYREKGGYPRNWEKIRIEVLKRDNCECGYCGKIAYVVDHIIPVSSGGTSDLGNLISSCKSCNSKKCNRTLEESGLSISEDKMKQICNSSCNSSETDTKRPTLPYLTLPNHKNKPPNPLLGEPDIPPDLQTSKADILAWLQYKREKGQGYKPSGLKALWNLLRQIPEHQRGQSIQKSMASNWAGLFQITNGKNPTPHPLEDSNVKAKRLLAAGKCYVCKDEGKIEKGIDGKFRCSICGVDFSDERKNFERLLLATAKPI